MSQIRTVLGDVPANSLGVIDYHEHLFQVTPLLPGDELDDAQLSKLEASRMLHAGVNTMVEATPLGLGRNAESVAAISAAIGMHLVHTTGLHHGGHYAPNHPLRLPSVSELSERFTEEILTGIKNDDGSLAKTPAGENIRAGLVKAAVRYWHIGEFERKALIAAAFTSINTGCAIMVHLDYGSAAHEVLDLLEEYDIPLSRVVLAHIDRNLDAGLHIDLAARGAYLGYDGAARHREAPDSAIINCLMEVSRFGGAERIVIGGDVARSTRYKAYGGMPGLEYLPTRFLPRLRNSLDSDSYYRVVSSNPARLLALVSGKSDET